MTNADGRPITKKKHKVLPLIYRIILIVIASLTVGMSFFSWNAKRVVGNQLPMPLGFGISVVLSGSMEPTLKVNDLVFVTESDDYQVDDIVVYQNGSELIIHRIIGIYEDQVITKGDANPVDDNPITMEMIKGKYSFRIPYLGLVFRFVKTLPGTLLILAAVVYLMYRSRKKERKSGEEELDKIAQEIRLLRLQQLAASEPEGTPEGDNSADSEKAPAEDNPSETKDNNIEVLSDESVVVDSRNQPIPSTESKTVKSDSDYLSSLSELSDIINRIES